jgi:hypothetical protein
VAYLQDVKFKGQSEKCKISVENSKLGTLKPQASQGASKGASRLGTVFKQVAFTHRLRVKKAKLKVQNFS